jgi:hypothetical protein
MGKVFNVSVMDQESKEELQEINVSVTTQLGELFEITDEYGQARFNTWVWHEKITFKCVVNDPRKSSYDDRYETRTHNAVTLTEANPYCFMRLDKKK